jgi:hypothetical protein
MAARNKPAGIRSIVYGIGKGKAGIEGLSVSEDSKRFDWYGGLKIMAKVWAFTPLKSSGSERPFM